MKKYLLVIVFILIDFNFAILAMEPAQSKTDIQKKMNAAFKLFGISAKNCVIDTVKSYDFRIPDSTLVRWAGGPHCVHLHEDIQKNPYLTEFAAHCIAAANKKDHRSKGIVSYYLAMSGVLAISGSFGMWCVFKAFDPFKLPVASQDELYYTFRAIGTSIIGVAPLTYLFDSSRISRMVDDAIANHYDKIAYTLGCIKLAESNNLKPLATYYAYAQLIEHRPLDQDDQINIIKWALKNNRLSITSARRNYNCTVAHIWKECKCVASGEYIVPDSSLEEVSLADFNTSGNMSVSWNNA